MCRVNNWTSLTDKVQNLSLALEGPAVEVLKDVDETSSTAFDDIWALLARRFGQTDEPRDAMRRFDLRRQMDGESIPEFEAALRILYREAWPHASAEQRDASLKRRFEDGVLNPELHEYLTLHTRDADFATTVLRARYFVETREITRPKKCVRIITPPPPDYTSDIITADDTTNFLQPLLKGIKEMMDERLPPASVKTVNREPSPSPASQSTRDGDNRRDSRPNNWNKQNRDRSQSPGNTNRPPRDGSLDSRPANSRPQSPAPYGRQSSGYDNRRQFRSPSPGPYRNQLQQSRTQSPYRSQFPYRPQSPAPRWNQRPQTPPPPPPPRYDRRSGTPPASYRRPYNSGYYNNHGYYFAPQSPPAPRDDARPPTPNPPDIRRRPKPGCFVCGNYGCHSQLHSPRFEDSPPDQRPPSSNPFLVNTAPPSQVPPLDPGNNAQGNNIWVRRSGDPDPNQANCPASH